ncbi:MAG: type II secretion system protein GspH [Proteobacteria bacterium]|nr:type II secretion system protein GspH [Pseudomonadota bacterium]
MEIKRSQPGFILFEILVVFVIFGLVLTIAPPLLPNVIASSKAKTATRDLAANLKKMRSLAISRQQETTLSLDIENKTFTVDKKLKKITLPDSTSLSIITAQSEQISENEGRIRFFADGSSTGGQIKLTHQKKEYLIDVNWLTGNIKILPQS